MPVDLNNIAQPGTRERLILDQLNLGLLPRHIAIIMDGNGRWAKVRHLPRVEGHRVGITSVRSTIELVTRLEIPVVTLYAFSTENWKRPRREIMTLMTLLKDYINRELAGFCRNNIKFRTIGRIDGLDLSVQKQIARAVEATRSCTGSVVQIALNYSGRQELTDLVRRAAETAQSGDLDPNEINESWISDHLQTGGLPEPDLMIRTSGEQRISNFLLWQLAYSEIYFSSVLWPEFTTLEFLKALLEFQQRNRRFGGLESGHISAVHEKSL